jgi:hypothetical protein
MSESKETKATGNPFSHSLKSRLIKYLLIALICAFFAIPVSMLCLHDCRYIASQKIGSILLFFFR